MKVKAKAVTLENKVNEGNTHGAIAYSYGKVNIKMSTISILLSISIHRVSLSYLKRQTTHDE